MMQGPTAPEVPQAPVIPQTEVIDSAPPVSTTYAPAPTEAPPAAPQSGSEAPFYITHPVPQAPGGTPVSEQPVIAGIANPQEAPASVPQPTASPDAYPAQAPTAYPTTPSPDVAQGAYPQPTASPDASAQTHLPGEPPLNAPLNFNGEPSPDQTPAPPAAIPSPAQTSTTVTGEPQPLDLSALPSSPSELSTTAISNPAINTDTAAIVPPAAEPAPAPESSTAATSAEFETNPDKLIENWSELSVDEMTMKFNFLMISLRSKGNEIDPGTIEGVTRAYTEALLRKTGFSQAQKSDS